MIENIYNAIQNNKYVVEYKGYNGREKSATNFTIILVLVSVVVLSWTFSLLV